MRYMDDREVIWGSQHSFTKSESCLANPVAFCEGVTTSLNKGRATDVISLDVCKGSHMVPHNLLVSKLERDGFSEWSSMDRKLIAWSHPLVVVNGSKS